MFEFLNFDSNFIKLISKLRINMHHINLAKIDEINSNLGVRKSPPWTQAGSSIVGLFGLTLGTWNVSKLEPCPLVTRATPTHAWTPLIRTLNKSKFQLSTWDRIGCLKVAISNLIYRKLKQLRGELCGYTWSTHSGFTSAPPTHRKRGGFFPVPPNFSTKWWLVYGGGRMGEFCS